VNPGSRTPRDLVQRGSQLGKLVNFEPLGMQACSYSKVRADTPLSMLEPRVILGHTHNPSPAVWGKKRRGVL